MEDFFASGKIERKEKLIELVKEDMK